MHHQRESLNVIHSRQSCAASVLWMPGDRASTVKSAIEDIIDTMPVFFVAKNVLSPLFIVYVVMTVFFFDIRYYCYVVIEL